MIEALHVHPDGKNINADCGSEHPESLIDAVLAQKADIGWAFDGDGDRLGAVDEKGMILSGDRILAICARSLKHKGLLKNNLVVSTVMSNLGLRLALKELGISKVQYNLEVIGKGHFQKICPGKSSYEYLNCFVCLINNYKSKIISRILRMKTKAYSLKI